MCYFSNGVTRVLRGMPFCAAACTGALYHIELYLVVGDVPDLPAGVYHYAAHDHSLRLLRAGDYRSLLVSAAGEEPHTAEAPVIGALTNTWWRNAWKYQARAYRHAFWDAGTVLANLLSVVCANGWPGHVVVAFSDAAVNRLLGVDPVEEATLCLVPMGPRSARPGSAPTLEPLNLPTQRLSAQQVEYPEIVQAHTASSLGSGVDAAAWRAGAPGVQPARASLSAVDVTGVVGSVERVILRRGSSRRFLRDAIARDQLQTLLHVATTPIPSDAPRLTQPYLILNAVDGLASGSYVYERSTGGLTLLREGEFRREAAFLDLGQELAGDAAVNVYWLADLAQAGERGYRLG